MRRDDHLILDAPVRFANSSALDGIAIVSIINFAQISSVFEGRADGIQSSCQDSTNPARGRVAAQVCCNWSDSRGRLLCAQDGLGS
jgi:hypothetical protein